LLDAGIDGDDDVSNEGSPDYAQPPGPDGHFLFGSSREFYAARARFIESLVASYGDVVRYRLGCDWHYLINDPSIAREMLRDWDRIDNTRPDRQFQLDESFIAKDGHARVEPRRIVHSTMCPRTVATSHDRMVRAVEQMLEDWHDGQERDVLLDMMRLNIELVSSSLFGRPSAWLAPVLPMLTDLQLLVGSYTNSEATKQRLLATRRPEVFAAIEVVIQEMVAGLSEPLPQRAPALEIMLRERAEGRMSQRHMVHELGVLLMTTAPAGVASTWAMFCLARHAEARERLEAELAVLPPGPIAHDDLDGLSYLPLFIKEVLRVYPPQAIISRGTYTEWTRDALQIPPNRGIDIAPYLLHRHPRFWHHPEQFRPERFDEGSSWYHPEQDLAYIPFGVGVRRCIGEGLAMRQLKVLVATVARRYHLELVSQDPIAFDISPLGVLNPEPVELPLRLRERATSPSHASTEACA
jgi:cytochrome P450